MLDTLPFRYLVAVDFEFEFGGHASFEEASRSGERPRPVCMVAKELRSGQTWRIWRGEFGLRPPFPADPDALFIAYYVSAELGCFRALGWPMPTNILDLFVEFRVRTNGLTTPAGSGLVGALTYFGLDGLGAQEKDELRKQILLGNPEREATLNYCQSDVTALERLLPKMLPRIDLQRALLRGRYMAAAATMEWNGVPIDALTLDLLREHWVGLQDDLIAMIDSDYGIYDGRTFKRDRWERYLAANNIPWPRLESGGLDLQDGTFREMAKSYPSVAPIRELRTALSDLRLNDLAVGRTGATARFCPRFEHERAETNPATRNTFSDRACGCAV
jgi:DNA polymerase I